MHLRLLAFDVGLCHPETPFTWRAHLLGWGNYPTPKPFVRKEGFESGAHASISWLLVLWGCYFMHVRILLMCTILHSLQYPPHQATLRGRNLAPQPQPHTNASIPKEVSNMPRAALLSSILNILRLDTSSLHSAFSPAKRVLKDSGR